MIGTIGLARRIEAAEVRLSLAMADAARTVEGASVFTVERAGGAAVFCGPASPMTKAIGFGLAAPIADEDIDAVEKAFAASGMQPGWEVSTLADLASIRRLESRGYRLQRIEAVLGCDLVRKHPVPVSDSGDMTVTRGPDDHWERIAVEAFTEAETVEGRDAPAEHYDTSVLEQTMAQLRALESVRRYVAWVDGVPASAGTARVDGGIFQLCGAGTLAAFRRRGLQTLLLSARLREAIQDGCDLAVVTVEPGSRSQANVQRHGFVPLYSRLVFALDA